MNRIFRTLWSVATQSWQAVPETAKTAGKKSQSCAGGAVAFVVLGLQLSGGAGAQSPPPINQLPTGGAVVRGDVTIHQTATAQAASMVVNQSSQSAVVNWESFNLGQAASIHFVQPNAQAAILNRVNDSNPSQLFGRISSNGQVFLTNANGVYFSPTASVDVGSITATTHSISDENFMTGNYVFDRRGATGKVINEGHIHTSLGGYVALLAPEVQNSGVVIARAGTVTLAAGEMITLKVDGVGGLAGITTTPSAIASLIENKQAVQAPDGQIVLSAVALNKLQAGVIKNSGELQANSLVKKGGKIFLEGDEITLTKTSNIEAKGKAGGGTVLVGGDWQGSGDLRQATKVTMQAGASIDVSATDKGDGGKVVLWSDIHQADSVTRVNGNIKAEAGPEGGNGGKVETSGHVLNVDGIQVSTNSPKGNSGEWLLDPYNISIVSDATVIPAGSTSFVDANNPGDDAYTPTATSSINASAVNAALANGNVTISTGAIGSDGSDAGNITISSGLSWASNKTLTLSAAGGVSGNQAISMTGGGTLVIDQSGSSTYSGVISGTGASLQKTGAGTLSVSALTYTGSTLISAGALQITGSLGTGEIINNSSLIFNKTANLTLPNVISGTGTLTKLSAYTLSLTGNSTFTGGTTVSAGIIEMGAGGSLGTGAVSLASANSTLSFNRTDNYTFSNLITGIGKITQSGVGTTSLTANNSFSGFTSVNAGKLQIGDGGTTGSVGAAGIILSTGAVLAFNRSNSMVISNVISGTGSVLQAGSGTTTLLGANTFNGGITISAGTLQIGNGGPATSIIGGNTITGTGSGTFAVNYGANATLSNTISGTVGVAQSGSGTLTLDGLNTYTGTTSILSGTLKPGTSSTTPFGNSSNIYFADSASAILDISGVQSTMTVGALNGGGTSGGNITLGARSLIYGSGNADGNYAGAISGIGSVTKTGSGTQVLSGASSYSGSTTLNAGVVKLGSASTTLNSPLGGSGSIIVSTGATLDLNGYGMSKFLSLTGGTLINTSTDSVTYTGTVGANGGTIKTDYGALYLSSIGGSSSMTLDGTTGGSISGDIGSNLGTKPGGFIKKGSGTWVLNSANIWTSGSTPFDIQAGTLQLGSTLSRLSISGTVNIASGAKLDVASNSDLTLSTTLTGSGTLSKSGGSTSTLILGASLGSPSFSGPVTVSSGVIAVGYASQANVPYSYLGTGNVTVFSGGALDVSSKPISNNITINGTGVNGGGAIINKNTANTSSATLSGILTLGSDSLITTGSGNNGINFSNTGSISSSNYSLTLGGTGSGTLSGAFNGSGNITKVGSGSWTLSSNTSTYTGETYINQGTLNVTAANALGSTSGGTTVASGATLALNFPSSANSATATVSENIQLTGPGVFNGSTYLGALTTTGQAATVNVTGKLTLSGTTLIKANSGKTLNVTQTIEDTSYDLAKINTVNLASQPLTVGSTGGVKTNYAFVQLSTSASVTYGDVPTITYSLFTTESAVTPVTGLTVTGSPAYSGLTSTSSVGTYQMTYASGLSTPGYALFGATATSISVTAKPITITNNAVSTTYDGVSTYATLVANAGYTTSATMVGTDAIGSLTQTLSNSNGALSGTGVAQAGTFTSTPSAVVLSSGLASNYSFTYAAATNNTVAKANLSITATPSLTGNVYNGSAYTGSYTTTALGSDASGMAVTGVATGTNAGTYSSSLAVSGSVLSNYNTPTITDANLVISPKPITLTGQMNYSGQAIIDTTKTGTTLSATNLVAGDSLSISGSATLAAATAGTQSITAFNGLSLSNSNYTTSGASGSVSVIPTSSINLTTLSTSELRTLIGAQLADVTNTQISSLSSSQLQVFSGQQISALSASQFSGLTPTQISLLSDAQIQAISPVQLALMTESQLGGLSPSQFSGLSIPQLLALTKSQISFISPAQLRQLSPSQIAVLTGNADTPLSVQQMLSLAPEQMAAVNPALIAQMTASDMRLLTQAQLQSLSAIQLSNLTPQQLAGFTSLQMASLQPSQIEGLSQAQLQAIGIFPRQNTDTGVNAQIASATQPTQAVLPEIAGMSGLQIRALTPEQLNALPKEQFASLNPAQLQALTTSQLSQLTPEQAGNFSPQQISVMSKTQVQALNPEVKAEAPVKTGSITVTFLQGSDTAPVTKGVEFEQSASTISLSTTPTQVSPVTNDKLVFSDQLTTFLVATPSGEMVEFQSGLVNNRMFIVAASNAAKLVVRDETNLVLAAAVTSLGKVNRIDLAQIESVIIDLR